jgi:hypothetical protein
MQAICRVVSVQLDLACIANHIQVIFNFDDVIELMMDGLINRFICVGTTKCRWAKKPHNILSCCSLLKSLGKLPLRAF